MTSALPVYTADELASYPAPELMQLLVRNEDRVPRTLIEESARRGDELLELLAAILEKDYYWTDDTTDGEWWLRFHAVMVLGRMTAPRAGGLLVSFMRRIDEAQDETLEEWLSGYWPALFRNKPDAFLPSLRELAENRAAGAYMRAQAIEAAVAHAQSAGTADLDAALAWAAKIAFTDREDAGLRVILGTMLLDFARPQFRKKLEQLADLQSSDDPAFDRKEITQVYFSRGRTPQWEWESFRDPWAFYEPEAIEARQREWEKADAELDQDDSGGDDTDVRQGPKVGRNDPCPCGSGKKYKKCCGAQTAD